MNKGMMISILCLLTTQLNMIMITMTIVIHAMSTEQLLPAKSPINIPLQALCAAIDAMAKASLETSGTLGQIILHALD